MCGRAWTLKYSGFTEVLPTRAFLVPLDEDEEIEVALGKGQSVSIKYKAVSELQPNGKRYAHLPSTLPDDITAIMGCVSRHFCRSPLCLSNNTCMPTTRWAGLRV